MSLNPLQPPPIDFDNLTWKCHICKMERKDSYIKVYKHDISQNYDLPTGTIVFNARHCNDVQSCKEKASSREYILTRLLGKSNENNTSSI